MEKSNFALRLLPSLHKAAQRIATEEKCSVNQLINLALAEKIAVLDAGYWDNRRREAGAGRPDVLERLAGDEAPQEGDEVPEELAPKGGKGARKKPRTEDPPSSLARGQGC